MKKFFVLLAFLIVVGICIPAVSAEKVIWDYTAYEFTDTSGYANKGTGDELTAKKYRQIYMKDISLYQTLNYVVVTIPSTNVGYSDADKLLSAGRHEFEYSLKDQYKKLLIVYIDRYPSSTKITMFFEDWDIEGLSGRQLITVSGMYFMNIGGSVYFESGIAYPMMITHPDQGTKHYLSYFPVRMDWASGIEWQNHINLTELDPNPLGGYEFSLTRIIDGKYHHSDCKVYKDEEVIFSESSSSDIKDRWFSLGSITQINVTSPTGRVYKFPVTGGADPDDPTDPGDPGETPTMRTGTVTMTDHNGTAISGFEVTAVNHYTGQEYTVSTDTDVAVISLPMDRTVEIRNPQTGAYEEVPIGYYRFYGQAPGYKMLYEDGIQVAVTPEKYSSYQLCNILVTSESGPLTGKHKFQIRSRSDNSILQTGTVSAKSATTGEWYNTTVSGGIATLILPYDTSNVVSQYAGNYYVYATSPGYEDSDYGTQIVVMPRTVSEIRDILLTPIGGVPTAGNVTLRIQAFSETGPGVTNADIFIAGVIGAGKSVWNTYTASSTGYLTVSVPGNSTYDIVASGAGYYDSARRIEVFTEDPPPIEIKLYLSGAPTVEPTTQPIEWPTTPIPPSPPITPTSTMTAPTGEPVSNWLEWFAAHFGMILGGGIEIGKIFMWLCFTLPVGVYVGKEAKAGAAGFMAGAGIVTLFFVLIGWVPIWLVVLLALIIGLLYAKVFNSQDNGGGGR